MAFCVRRASSLDNVDILGEDYIRQMKRDLPPYTFAVSILNVKMQKSNDGFYSNLDIDHVHGYIPDDGADPLSSAHFSTQKVSGIIDGKRITSESYQPDFKELGERNDSRPILRYVALSGLAPPTYNQSSITPTHIFHPTLHYISHKSCETRPRMIHVYDVPIGFGYNAPHHQHDYYLY